MSIPGEEFVVERILHMRRVRGGHRRFLVKWLGYPDSENTWEPERNLTGCGHLIADFLGEPLPGGSQPVPPTSSTPDETPDPTPVPEPSDPDSSPACSIKLKIHSRTETDPDSFDDPDAFAQPPPRTVSRKRKRRSIDRTMAAMAVAQFPELIQPVAETEVPELDESPPFAVIRRIPAPGGDSFQVLLADGRVELIRKEVLVVKAARVYLDWMERTFVKCLPPGEERKRRTGTDQRSGL
jgi:hypothetical protein